MENEISKKDTEIVVSNEKRVDYFANNENFTLIQRMAKMLSQSTIIPKDYRGSENISNCIIALEIASRLNLSPMVVMQNLYIINSRPSWSSQALIAMVNNCGQFTPLRFVFTGEENSDEWTCYAVATELSTGELLKGPKISFLTAKKEGWYSKQGSKWQTMPELMMRYRAAAFFARVYTPEITLGFLTEHEQNDLPITDTKSIKLLDTLAIKFKEIGVDTTKFFELTGIEWNVDNLDKIKDAYFSLKDSNLDKTEIK